MSLPAENIAALEMKHDFMRAVNDVLNDPTLQSVRPSLPVTTDTLEKVLSPISKLINNEGLHKGDVTLSDILERLRTICTDVHVRHATDDKGLIERRALLVDTLEDMKEQVSEGVTRIDFEVLHDLTDILRGNSSMYKEFMSQPVVSEALHQCAESIEQTKWGEDLRLSFGAQSANEELRR